MEQQRVLLVSVVTSILSYNCYNVKRSAPPKRRGDRNLHDIHALRASGPRRTRKGRKARKKTRNNKRACLALGGAGSRLIAGIFCLGVEVSHFTVILYVTSNVKNFTCGFSLSAGKAAVKWMVCRQTGKGARSRKTPSLTAGSTF